MLDFLYGIGILISAGLFVVFESFHPRQNMSTYEAKRRAQSGDKFFKQVVWAQKYREDFQFTLRLISLILLIGYSTLLAIKLPQWWAVTLLDLALVIVARYLSLIKSLHSFYENYVYRQVLFLAVKITKLMRALVPIFYPKKSVKSGSTKPFYSQEEFLHNLEVGSDVLDPKIAAKLNRTLNLENQKLTALMHPVNTLPKIELASSLTPIIVNEMHSRGYPFTLVYSGKESNLVGILNLNSFEIDGTTPQNLTVQDQALTNLHYASQNSNLGELIQELGASGKNYSFISGAGGQIVGVIDLHDILSWLGAKDL